MNLHEISTAFRPRSICISGAETMRAVAKQYKGTAWLSLGNKDEPEYADLVSIFFAGPNAFERARRVADAINAALAEEIAQPANQIAAE